MPRPARRERKRSKAVAFCCKRVYTGRMKIASPKLPEQLQPLAAEEAEALLAAEERVYGACLAGGLPLRFPNAAFACTRFSSCSFTAALLKGADFADCVFDRCDFSGADFAGASFRRAEFCECKGVGADLSECSVSDAVFDKCNFSYANLSHAKLRDVRAASCDFSYADLDGCALRNFETDKTRFVRTNFFGTPLRGVDLSSCTLAGLTLSAQLTGRHPLAPAMRRLFARAGREYQRLNPPDTASVRGYSRGRSLSVFRSFSVKGSPPRTIP